MTIKLLFILCAVNSFGQIRIKNVDFFKEIPFGPIEEKRFAFFEKLPSEISQHVYLINPENYKGDYDTATITKQGVDSFLFTSESQENGYVGAYIDMDLENDAYILSFDIRGRDTFYFDDSHLLVFNNPFPDIYQGCPFETKINFEHKKSIRDTMLLKNNTDTVIYNQPYAVTSGPIIQPFYAPTILMRSSFLNIDTYELSEGHYFVVNSAIYDDRIDKSYYLIDISKKTIEKVSRVDGETEWIEKKW